MRPCARLITWSPLSILCFVASVLAAGPDIQVGEVTTAYEYSRTPDHAAIAFTTVSCNYGDQPVQWRALPDNRHPVIAMNLYRLQHGRMQQIGQSGVKHGLYVASANACNLGCRHASAQALGPGCSDPYGASLNHTCSLMGPRGKINAWTGAFDGVTAQLRPDPQCKSSMSRGIHVNHVDLGQPGARYFIEAHYIAPDDAAAGNGHNNVAYREVSVTPGARWIFSDIGQLQRGRATIYAWDGASLADVDAAPHDGRLVVGSRTTRLPDARYRYDYAVYNMNSERGIRSFALQLGPAIVTNPAFHGPFAHGEAWSNTPWTPEMKDGWLTWSTEAYEQNPNANALRWGTMYTFTSESDAAPVKGVAVLRRFKPGSGPDTVSIQVEVPSSSSR